MSETTATLKERIEAQLIADISTDPVVRALLPKKQNKDAKPKMPYCAVVASVGKEVSPGAGIYQSTAAIEFYFDASRDQTGASLDRAVTKTNERLAAAQARGQYGLILSGEQPTQVVSDTIRKRVISLGIVAG